MLDLLEAIAKKKYYIEAASPDGILPQEILLDLDASWSKVYMICFRKYTLEEGRRLIILVENKNGLYHGKLNVSLTYL